MCVRNGLCTWISRNKNRITNRGIVIMRQTGNEHSTGWYSTVGRIAQSDQACMIQSIGKATIFDILVYDGIIDWPILPYSFNHMI